jgi:hypothetical protein
MRCLGVRCNGSVRSSVRSERPLEVGGCSRMTLGTTNTVMTALLINVVSRIHTSESSPCRQHLAHTFIPSKVLSPSIASGIKKYESMDKLQRNTRGSCGLCAPFMSQSCAYNH